MKFQHLNIVFLFWIIPFFGFSQKRYVSFKMGAALSYATAKSYAGQASTPIGESFGEQADLNHVNVGASIVRTNMLNNKWGIEWGLSYFNIGYKEKEIPIALGIRRRYKYQFEYLSVPFSIKYYLDKQQTTSIYIGNTFAWMAQQRMTLFTTNFGNTVRANFKNIGNYHRLNCFAFLGANWAFKIDNRFDFIFDLQVLRSILEFNKHGFEDPAFYHVGIVPTIGLQYLIE